MRVVIFCHSLESDWNHGNAHFLRGVAKELQRRGHQVRVYEPQDGWSRKSLLQDHGPRALTGFSEHYPTLSSVKYSVDSLDLGRALDGADLVLVHEWNESELVARIGRRRARSGGFRLLFHDTHHRAVTAPEQMQQYDLRHYDGVLAFGDVLREIYLDRSWTGKAWTWHEAADVDLFRPLPKPRARDIVWVGNWGDEERTNELASYLLNPVLTLGLSGTVFGVRYPEAGKQAVQAAGLSFGDWLPNYFVPRVAARHQMTVHIPRRPYAAALPGIPTIRVFEALACGIPLISAPWQDSERLFSIDTDFLMARNPAEMTEYMKMLRADRQFASAMAERGRRRVLERHTCAHRVDKLLRIARALGLDTRVGAVA